jgi:DNA primase
VRYPPHILEEIRARLPVSTVVGPKVRLKKAGREWRGLSPFNAEKTPSFYANDQKSFYHCFSSGKHGDIFTFLMETEGLSFPEAVERLAAEAGVDLPRPEPGLREREERGRDLGEVLELAAAWFQDRLRAGIGRAARDYLAGRQVSAASIDQFRIGYAPSDRYGLRDHLAAEGVSPELMIGAGLLATGEDVAVPYDKFRDRVMFPIADWRGRVVGFGGRALRADVPAKYLNSPETSLFRKGQLLFNGHSARRAAHDKGTVIAVEGYLDVVAMVEAGFPHVVAPLGTALTEEQLGLLWRMADEPILCFDGDKAGRRAAYRAVDLALPNLPAGKSLRFALLPEGQDPDDLARSGGAAALEPVLAAARPLADMLWAKETEAAPSDTPERRAALARRIREAVATIRDETIRRFYRDDVETRLAALRQGPERFSGGRWKGGATSPGGASGYLHGPGLSVSPALASRLTERPDFGASPREALIVAALFAHPELLHDHADMLAGLDIADRDARALCDLLLDCALHDEHCEVETLAGRAERAELGPALGRMRARVRPGDRWLLHPAVDSVRLVDALRQAFTLQRRARTLNSELKAAERALAEDGSEANLVWLRDVQAELQSVEGAEADTDAA